MVSQEQFPPTNVATQVEAIATQTPERIYCKLILGDGKFEGIQDVTFAQLHRAVNRMSFWLDEILGPSKNFDSFAFYGDPDIQYALMVTATAKTQRQVVLVDGSTNQDGLIKTLVEFNCSTWIGSERTIGVAKELASKRPELQVVTLPPLDYWLKDVDVPNYPYSKPWAEAMFDPNFVLQTSGSTGNPKSFIHSHAMTSLFNNTARLPDGSRENASWAQSAFCGATTLWLPRPWWLGGIVGMVHFPFFNDMIVVVGPNAPFPVTSDWVLDVLENVQLDMAFMMPSLIRDICLQERGLKLLKKLGYLAFAGAPLDPWVGDLLCQEVALTPVIGSTEMSTLFVHRPKDPRDWQYYNFDKRLGYQMEPVGDGLYEMVLYRKDEYRRYQGIFLIEPQSTIYHTKDLYTPHPEKQDMWRHSGRADDLFKLKWQTRVKAGEIESELERHDQIHRAMVGGEGRLEPFVIVELEKAAVNGNAGNSMSNSTNGDAGNNHPVPTTTEEKVWFIVKAVNERLDAEFKIPRTHVIIASHEKPLQRTLKGSLNRPVINAAYKEEIEALYKKK